MARILLVGTATLDLVYTLERYPAEDDEMRAAGLRVCRGGNASNTAVVLAQLGHACSFVGVLSQAAEAAVITQDFSAYKIDASGSPAMAGRPPTSSIYLCGASRTIVHYRDLPELTAEQFGEIDLKDFDWIHFEGRNVPELLKMLARARQICPEVPVSLELEKPRPGIEAAWNLANVLICSRGYAGHQGYGTAEAFLMEMHRCVQHAEVVVAWGDVGAFGITAAGNLVSSPAFPPREVKDTLGAGDVFNAAFIDALLRGESLQDAVRAGCVLAGRKCGYQGLNVPAL